MTTMAAIEHTLNQEDEHDAHENIAASTDSSHTSKSIPASADSACTSKGGDAACNNVEVVDPPFGPSTPLPCSAEQRLRSRIDKFVAGYALTPMGKAIAFNWITVGLVCLRWLSLARIGVQRLKKIRVQSPTAVFWGWWLLF